MSHLLRPRGFVEPARVPPGGRPGPGRADPSRPARLPRAGRRIRSPDDRQGGGLPVPAGRPVADRDLRPQDDRPGRYSQHLRRGADDPARRHLRGHLPEIGRPRRPRSPWCARSPRATPTIKTTSPWPAAIRSRRRWVRSMPASPAPTIPGRASPPTPSSPPKRSAPDLKLPAELRDRLAAEARR